MSPVSRSLLAPVLLRFITTGPTINVNQRPQRHGDQFNSTVTAVAKTGDNNRDEQVL